MIYPVSHYRSVSLNYVIHQWMAHFGALPLPSAPVVDDAPDAVADGLGVAWFPAQRPEVLAFADWLSRLAVATRELIHEGPDPDQPDGVD